MNGASTVMAILCIVLGGAILLSAGIVWLSNKLRGSVDV